MAWQGQIVKKISIALAICALLTLMVFVDKEVDQKPTPRALLNLAGLYFIKGRMDEALDLWLECANYNKIYGTNYKPSQWPQGSNIKVCYQNYLNNKFLKNDPLFKRGR